MTGSLVSLKEPGTRTQGPNVPPQPPSFILAVLASPLCTPFVSTATWQIQRRFLRHPWLTPSAVSATASISAWCPGTTVISSPTGDPEQGEDSSLQNRLTSSRRRRRSVPGGPRASPREPLGHGVFLSRYMSRMSEVPVDVTVVPGHGIYVCLGRGACPEVGSGCGRKLR